MVARIEKEELQDEATLQLDANGNLRHLLPLKGRDKALLIDILDDAEQYPTPPGSPPSGSDALAVRMAVLDRVSRAMTAR